MERVLELVLAISLAASFAVQIVALRASWFYECCAHQHRDDPEP